MNDYWEKRYSNEGMIWGREPSPTALHALAIFRKNNVRSLLVPGSGYGRNTKVFSSALQVDGIEISHDAIQLALEWDRNAKFIQGSLLSDSVWPVRYDAVYCYNVLHLFLRHDRDTFIRNCAKQLKPAGLMYFTCFSDEDGSNRVGKQVEEGTFEYKANKYAHFFSDEDLRSHFMDFNILETGSITETLRYADDRVKEYALRYIVLAGQ